MTPFINRIKRQNNKQNTMVKMRKKKRASIEPLRHIIDETELKTAKNVKNRQNRKKLP